LLTVDVDNDKSGFGRKMDRNSSKNWSFLICLSLTFATAAVFYQVCTYDFVNYDDQIYVYENQNIQAGITLKAIKWAFTANYANFWHPLTLLSHMLDWQLFGTNAGGHHLTNLIFHIANTLLLFLVLKQMTSALWQSAFVAALFALHPLHVESVAWVSERKDVLSTFFWMLTMWAYLRYVKYPNVARYLLTLLIFALGLMAKPMLITLPFVLLLLDYWPLGRINRFQWQIIYRLVWEKIPFIVLSAVSSVVAFFVQPSGGAVTQLAKLGLKIRIYNALISYVTYIEKMLWPSRLTVFYPIMGQNISVLYVAVSVAVLLAVTILILRLAQNHRYLVTGWFWYLGTLLPVIGLIPVGDHAMADRYSYITLTGLFIIIAWGFPDLLAKWTSASSVESRYKKNALILSALLIISAMSICTWFQLRYWRNGLTLFQHALDVTKNNYVAHFCIADPLVSQGRLDEAIYHYSEAIRILPDYVDALNDFGAVLHREGRIDEAIGYYKRAIQVNPLTARVHLNLAAALADKGSFAEAVTHYRTGLAAMDVPVIRRDFGSVLVKLGRFEEAAAEYRKVLLAMPDDPNVLNELGCVLAHTGKFDEAIAHFNKALQIAPSYTAARNNLNIALAEKQKTQNKDAENAKK
jgi:tetratricopeptide (TPR) repeat protein